jgi:hypothetical protein
MTFNQYSIKQLAKAPPRQFTNYCGRHPTLNVWTNTEIALVSQSCFKNTVLSSSPGTAHPSFIRTHQKRLQLQLSPIWCIYCFDFNKLKFYWKGDVNNISPHIWNRKKKRNLTWYILDIYIYLYGTWYFAWYIFRPSKSNILVPVYLCNLGKYSYVCYGCW